MTLMKYLLETATFVLFLGSVYAILIVSYVLFFGQQRELCFVFGQQAMEILTWINTLISLGFCLSPSILLYKVKFLGLMLAWIFCSMSIFASMLWLQIKKCCARKIQCFIIQKRTYGRTLFCQDMLTFLAQRFCRGSTVYLFNFIKPSQHYFYTTEERVCYGRCSLQVLWGAY